MGDIEYFCHNILIKNKISTIGFYPENIVYIWSNYKISFTLGTMAHATLVMCKIDHANALKPQMS